MTFKDLIAFDISIVLFLKMHMRHHEDVYARP